MLMLPSFPVEGSKNLGPINNNKVADLDIVLSHHFTKLGVLHGNIALKYLQIHLIGKKTWSDDLWLTKAG